MTYNTGSRPERLELEEMNKCRKHWRVIQASMMYSIRPGLRPRAFQAACKASRGCTTNSTRQIQFRRSSNKSHTSKRGFGGRLTIAVLVGGIATAAVYYGSQRFGLFEEVPLQKPVASAEVKIEKPKQTKRLSKEENRDTISSQHVQVKQSWENPGVYAWGSNSGRVVAPDSDEALIKNPKRIPFFDGLLLRDIKLDRNFGAAITENGDLLQWGTGYSKDSRQPMPTLTGKNLISLTISRDRILALGSNGNVYSLPVSQSDQASGPKPLEDTWIPFWPTRSPVSYRRLQPKTTSWGEKVLSISSGLEHMLLLTSSGRVFSAASSSSEFPSRGQMGVPGLTWSNRPVGPYDQPHEITTLRGFNIISIAAGDYHSLVLDKEGRVFAFGDSMSGQLGFDPSASSPYIDVPYLLPIQKLYEGTGLLPRVTSVSAGGANSFFTTEATRVAHSDQKSSSSDPGRITADTWACGQGILGTLGTGRWTHIQGAPVKIKALSNLFEYDEKANAVVPIRLKRLSVGETHASATMDNVTQVRAGLSSSTDSANDTNWGADVLWWGGNEFFQLGMGKRNNVSTPLYIVPLDAAEKGRQRQDHRFQITPQHVGKVGERRVRFEQRVECGRMISAVYSGV
ncbi:hypothetical protein MMC07_003144 [Pseudocyphellaria aurata]|nr:hypothetical protein [Pseudocyphellaria aurata]